MPQTPLDVLAPYFFSGTAEGEKRILKEVFIPPGQMAEVLNLPEGNPRILVGSKGMGKSAMLNRFYDATRAQKLPALFLTPSNLDLRPLQGHNDLATIERTLFQCLVRAVAVHIGTQLAGLLSNADKKLRDEALKEGLIEEDFIERGIKLLAAVARPTTQVDFAQLAKDLAGGTSDAALLNSITGHMEESESVMLVLFDDTDQVASPDEPKELNRIWGMLHALRDLASRVPQIKVVATLRSEVWTRLRDPVGNRETLDHFHGCIMHLKGSEELLDRIVQRRVLKAAEKASKGPVRDPWALFFEGSEVHIPGAGPGHTRGWRSFLVTNSRERPRDLIQFVSFLLQTAKTRIADTEPNAGPQARITGSDVARSLPRFSKTRLEDLSTEVGKACPQFFAVAESFCTLSSELRYDELHQHLAKLPSRFSIQLRGKSLRPDSHDAAAQLHALLFEAGFINARVDDPGQPRGYRHLTFADRPELTDPAHVNEARAARWDVHPVFRSHLLQIKPPPRKV
ncbi:P-loop ATPase, Sll1717 family [Archangium gephyra]|uniref:P-loop ATPase, Sll1717 family n=1 Tax=Archangium gephyra TaxID=48 RepID=UPI003B7E3B97